MQTEQTDLPPKKKLSLKDQKPHHGSRWDSQAPGRLSSMEVLQNEPR